MKDYLKSFLVVIMGVSPLLILLVWFYMKLPEGLHEENERFKREFQEAVDIERKSRLPEAERALTPYIAERFKNAAGQSCQKGDRCFSKWVASSGTGEWHIKEFTNFEGRIDVGTSKVYPSFGISEDARTKGVENLATFIITGASVRNCLPPLERQGSGLSEHSLTRWEAAKQLTLNSEKIKEPRFLSLPIEDRLRRFDEFRGTWKHDDKVLPISLNEIRACQQARESN